jgi:GTP pyrophosphokinase
MGPKGRIVDIQIRTQAMHDADEFGLASHWKYKQGMTQEERIKYLRASWIQRVLSVLKDSKPNEILNDAKTEIKEFQVMVFTESGEVIYLPYKSTILDFAFAVNKKLGIYFDYAIVNGQQVGIDYIINNGDKVIIHTAKKSSVNSIWLNYAITGKARNAIIELLK